MKPLYNPEAIQDLVFASVKRSIPKLHVVYLEADYDKAHEFTVDNQSVNAEYETRLFWENPDSVGDMVNGISNEIITLYRARQAIIHRTERNGIVLLPHFGMESNPHGKCPYYLLRFDVVTTPFAKYTRQ